MDASFYSAARGAMTEQEKMNVISNNMANFNTVGYRSKSTVFSDLLYYNMHSYDRNSTGTGVKVQHTNTNFNPGGLLMTDPESYDYAIDGEGFFMVRDEQTGALSYTRSGKFSLSRHEEEGGTVFYLFTDGRKQVLDRDGEPIRLVEKWQAKDYVPDEDAEETNDYAADEVDENGIPRNLVLSAKPAVYTFENMDNMQAMGKNEFVPVEKNGPPILRANARVVRGYLELSNTDAGQDFTDMIIASRAYSYALKMVTTSDEVEQTINGLRS